MRYRKLDADGDYTFGRSERDFWKDVPDAVGQHVLTRLRLQQGEWFLDATEGTPWKTQVLGKYTGSTRDAIIRFRTMDTQGARDILDYSSNLDRETRGFNVNLTIDTIYGAVKLREPI